MAVALEGFSIREYAANMRIIDFDKCWPFDGGGGGGGGGGGRRKSLPQISVRKFRFWSDEVKLVDEAKAEETPAIRTTPSKGKQRAPKKRSIVELFAVAPPIEAAVDADVDDSVDEKEMKESEVKEGENSKKAKATKKLMKGKMIKRRRMKKLKIEICASEKEKIDKLTSSAHIFHKLQGSKHKLSSGKNSKNPVDRRKKLAQRKNRPKNHKLKLLQSSKQISKKQRGPGKVWILKSRARGSAKKARVNIHTQRGNCESEHHATISGEDGLVGHTNSYSPIDIPQFRSLCKIFSDVLAASSALDNTCKGDNLPAAADVAQPENGSDTNAVRNIAEQTEGTSYEKEQLSEPHSDLMHLSSKSYSDTERSSVSILADQHHSMQTNGVDSFVPGTSTLLASGKHLEEPRMVESIHSEGLSCSSDTQLKEASLKTSGSQSLAPLGRCDSRSDVRGSLSFIRNPSTLPLATNSAMTMEENRQQPQPPVDSLIDSSWQISELHPIHHLPSKDLMESMHTSVGSRLVPHPVPALKDKCTGESFVGLPLNSQGELIHLQSGAKFGFSEISKRQHSIQGSIHSSLVPCYVEPQTSDSHVKIMKGKFPGPTLNQKDQSGRFPEQYFHVSKPAISGDGFTNLQSFERFGVRRNETSSDRDQFFLHDLKLREVSCHGCREENHTQNYIDRVNFQAEGIMHRVSQPNIQQTMRLMGTNVTVGGNNKESQSYVDGKIWTDKEVVTDKCPSVRVSDGSLPQQWLQQQQQQQQQQQWVTHQSSGMPKDNLFHPMDASSNLYHMPATAQRLGLTQFDYRPQWVSRNGTSSATGHHRLKVDLLSHPVNPQLLLNENSKFGVTSIPGITSITMGHQIPMVASKPQAYQHMLLNSTHCKHSQGIAYSTTSTFRPPFLYYETGSSIQPSAVQSSPNLPQWLLNAKQQKKSQEASCSCYADPVSSHHHRSMARAEAYPFPSPRPTTAIFSACSSTTSQKGGLSTPPVAQASFGPSCTCKTRTAMDDSTRRKNMLREGANFNFTYLKCLDAASKSRKRPAAKDDGFMKPAKKPFLRLHKDTSASGGLRQGEQMDRNTPHAKTTTTVPNNSEIVTKNEGLRSLSLSSSLKVDGGSKSGPIKLSAGAKHILKPGQDTDQDNFRCTHSTVPFSIGNISGKVLDPQMKKAAEIYRF